MSDASQGPGWWQASDGKWYPPEQHPQYQPQPTPATPTTPPIPAPPPVPGYGYAVPPGMFVDPGSNVVLPQGVMLASVGRRIGAYFLSIVLVIVTLVIGYVIWGLVLWGKGTSPAFRVLGLRCWVVEEKRPAGFWRMALRNIVGGIVQSILGWITGLVSLILFLARSDHRSLPDLVGGTVVISDPNKLLDQAPTRADHVIA